MNVYLNRYRPRLIEFKINLIESKANHILMYSVLFRFRIHLQISKWINISVVLSLFFFFYIIKMTLKKKKQSSSLLNYC